jgi:hypothetical protein
MVNVFGDHQVSIPYEPVAELLAKYRGCGADKTAIVDLEIGSAINFGQLVAREVFRSH